ncbi:MAG: hypothetical protein JOZ81_15040 [Chloroflexi bacterium]|nr:hypothetical protein [Chloroflexota bacterium]MBV9546952.1 hypothetical protein [Chloroflexota bacterium]
MSDLSRQGHVTNLGLDPSAHDVYTRTNEAILEHGLALSGGAVANVLAMIVWEGQARGPDDNTAAFEAAARERGIRVTFVLTT